MAQQASFFVLNLNVGTVEAPNAKAAGADVLGASLGLDDWLRNENGAAPKALPLASGLGVSKVKGADARSSNITNLLPIAGTKSVLRVVLILSLRGAFGVVGEVVAFGCLPSVSLLRREDAEVVQLHY